MRFLLLVVLIGLTSSATVQNVTPVLDYHETIGLPLAAGIKAKEDALFSQNNTEEAEVKIVGGVIAPVNAHPYLAGIVIYIIGTTGVSACGSSLLTANRLVTAAHCWMTTGHLAYQFEVVLGSQYLFYGGTRIVTSNVVMHSQYNAALLANDVAMIYLPSNVAFTQNIQPIALPSTTQLAEDFTGWWATAVGYGKTSDQQTGVTIETTVNEVMLQVISNAECQMTFAQWVTNGNVCTSGMGGVGICGGDSGGPLVVNSGGRTILIGISSFVANLGCQLWYPSAFARITSFYSFIVAHII